MGCTASKRDDEEAMRLCRDRKNFIKQAMEQRNRFASDHIAYAQSLRRVSAALSQFTDTDCDHDFFFTSNLIPIKSLKSEQIKPKKSPASLVNFLRLGGNPLVSVEEEPEAEETGRIENFYSMDQHSGINNMQWDQLWNPFLSLDSYGYPSSFGRIIDDDDDDVDGLRQIREEEGIPELEDVDGEENKENLKFWKGEKKNEKPKSESKHDGVETSEKVPELENKSPGSESTAESETGGTVNLETPNRRKLGGANGVEETPGYTVYVNRRPASMAEAMKDIENQFMRICDSAREVSVILEASRVRNSTVSSELAARMMNPVTFVRPSTSKIGQSSSSSKEDNNGLYCMIPVSHKATLDRLYEWEKKLYEEVKAGEWVRVEYERKCEQLSHHDIYGEEPSAVERTIVAIRELHTHVKVHIRTVESISKRIEALRDAELCPQLMKLIQGIFRMWKTMADSHRIQKRIIEDAKLLPFTTFSKNPSKASHAAASLETEVQNWRRCLANWINTSRSYAGALAGWASSCTSPEASDAIDNCNVLSALSPFRGGEMPPVFGMCRKWSRLLESIREKSAMEGMEFFAAGMASVSVQLREAERAGMPVTELASMLEMEKMVLSAGFSVALGSMAVLAGEAVEGYDALVRRRRGEGRRGK
ncbi:uncharacterized protein LOC110019330 isoform X2 [Phalaenopsis equestris]|uniref:uncharacterized protein LOC110019330 isoform X2 n=1 Tax=Phalaenopsis equestris TaxID=78828 RepID=UPI0009E2BA34|nr:uncharacterized protein LOC110019330 isoform X2 [Phalaenopsis equestris]